MNGFQLDSLQDAWQQAYMLPHYFVNKSNAIQTAKRLNKRDKKRAWSCKSAEHGMWIVVNEVTGLYAVRDLAS